MQHINKLPQTPVHTLSYISFYKWLILFTLTFLTATVYILHKVMENAVQNTSRNTLVT